MAVGRSAVVPHIASGGNLCTVLAASFFHDELKLRRLALLRGCGELGTLAARIEQDRYTLPTESVKWLDTEPPSEADDRSLVLFDAGDEVVVQAGDDGIRFLLVSGEPLKEPVAWYGPIVMNTQEQLQLAFEQLREGTFLKPRT